MSQQSYTIDDLAGAAHLAQLNALAAAIVTKNAGATEPAETHAYMWWADTTSGWLKQRNAADNAWIKRVPLGTSAWVDVASAATLNLDADAASSDKLRITGTTATTAITLAEGQVRMLRAAGAWPITHGASLIVPGSASYTCAAGDLVLAIGEAGGVVRLAICKADGTAVVAPSATTDTTARDQIALTNLRLLLNTAVATGALVQGKQWELATDEWGGTSTNESYTNGSISYYSNPASTVLIGGGTAQGAFTLDGGLAAAFDGNTSQSYTSCARSATTPSGYGDASAIGKDWGSGVTKTVTRLRMYSPSDDAFLGSGAAVGFKLQGSSDNSSWNDLYAGTTPSGSAAMVDVTSGITASAYRYHRVTFNGNGSSALRVAEVQFFESGSVPNMTLIPDAAVSVSAAPTYMDAYFLYKDDSGSAVLGTDLTVELSRDGGTTWTTATLTTLASFDGTYSAIKARADVSGQPSGTSMTCRIKTLNNKAQRIAAPALYAE